MQQHIPIVNENLNLQDLDEIRNLLQSKINSVDLTLQLPPYLSTFFQPLRQKAFQNYINGRESDGNQRKQSIYKFIQLVDVEILGLFSEQLIKPYLNLILIRHYGIPQDLDVEMLKKDNKTLAALNDLACSIANWNVQIEITVDNIARVQLYNLWAPSAKIQQAQLTAELKGILSPSDDFDFKTYSKHILIKLLAQGAEKFGKYLYANGLSESNLSYGAALLIYHALVGKSALPWNVILPNVSLKWLFGGLVGSLALGKVSNYLEKCDQVEQLTECALVFQEITNSMISFNETLSGKINDVLLTVNEQQENDKKQELTLLIDTFLTQPESIKEPLAEIITSDDIIKHDQEEWQIIH